MHMQILIQDKILSLSVTFLRTWEVEAGVGHLASLACFAIHLHDDQPVTLVSLSWTKQPFSQISLKSRNILISVLNTLSNTTTLLG